MENSPFFLSVETRTIRLSGMLGPFLHVHKKLIDEAFNAGKIKILHSPLSCFEVKVIVKIGDDDLSESNFSPTDLKPTASEFHQILMFSFPINIPDALFMLPNLSLSVTLLHKIEDYEPVFVATGKAEKLLGDVIFTLSGGESNPTSEAIMKDLLKLHINTFVVPMYRTPSPISTDFASQSIDLFSGDISTSEMECPFIGDMEKYSSAVSNVFAAVVSAPSTPFIAKKNEDNNFKRPRFFKDKETPTYDQIPRINQIINNPFIAGISEADFSLLEQYKKYVSSFPSGFLKLASKNIFVAQPDLPFILALYCLVLGDAQIDITRHAELCLRKAPPATVRNFVGCLVQTAITTDSVCQFLYERSATDHELAVSAYWGLLLEHENVKHAQMAEKIINELEKRLPADVLEDIIIGKNELDRLKDIIEGVKTVPKEGKVAYVKEKLGDGSVSKPFRFPLKPSFIVTKISTNNIIVFGSSLQPVKLDFINAEGEIFSAILKVGDDMRQDALALSLITFMDDRLKKYGYDLCMTPYRVLPMSLTYGMCEFVVGAKAVSKVLEQNQGTIEKYLEGEEAREVFIKSCAGYSVISYVLGVGDRHLDNLLVSKKGNFLHVDFGFMFGKDPKPIPGKVRVVQEMTQAMGTEGTERFLRLCSIAFVAVRHTADEILCSLSLMMDAQLPHLPRTNEMIAKTLLANLALDISDEEAGKLMVKTVMGAITAIFPQINEWFHRLAN